MSYMEQIASFEASRAAKASEQKSIMDEAASKGETLDADGQEKFDELQGEIEAIDGHLKRLSQVEKSVGASLATPVAGDTAANASASRGGTDVRVKAQPKLAPGIALARIVKCFGMAKGNVYDASRLAGIRYGEDSNAFGTLKSLAERGFQAIEKAEVPAGSTQSGS
jgi:hypothetical protein